MNYKCSINHPRIENIYKSKKRLKNGIAYWSLFYLLSFNIIHYGLQLSFKVTVPITLFVLYLNYLSFAIRIRDYNKQLLDALLFPSFYQKKLNLLNKVTK